MDKNLSKGKKLLKTAYYAGSGLVIGAGVGMVLGPLLVENLAQGSAIAVGAALGLVIGAEIDTLGSRETDTNDKEDA